MGNNKNKRILAELFENASTSKELVLIFAFLFATSWLGNVLYDIVKDKNKMIAYIAFGFISFVILAKLSSYYKELVKKYPKDDQIDINKIDKWGFKILVVFLSEYKKEIPYDLSEKNAVKWLREGHNSWLMPYLAITRYKTTLDKVYILTSKESSPQYSKFEEIIKPIVENNNIALSEQKVEDINDIDDYTAIFNTIYNDCKDYSEDSIVIDVTSGTKLYSIAGSYFALSSEKIVQYIDTNDTSKPPYKFNNKVLSQE